MTVPKYEFQCNTCKETFDVTMSVKDKGITQIFCPSCKSQDLEQLYNGINIHIGI
jgi:putative FmdB family regulatory protein